MLGIHKRNISRGRITAATFLIIEAIILIATVIWKRETSFQRPDVYYELMYLLMVFGMLVFFMLFDKLKRNMTKFTLANDIVGLMFTTFILGWCAGISLLDFRSGGEVFIYMISLIAAAVTPIFRPLRLLLIYIVVHTMFLSLLSISSVSDGQLSGIFINSTTVLIVCWAISYMRFRSRAEDFVKNKTMLENTEELKRLNLELEEANHKLEILSLTDGLTGIYNRSAFDKILKKEWQRCKKHQKFISIIMIDIDFFKSYNDNNGHQAGDFCLKLVAEVLTDCASCFTSTVVRYGGEEFAIVIPSMEKGHAIELAEKMRYSVENLKLQHSASSVSDYITISLGVHSELPTEEIMIEAFIEKADQALYEAKRKNRNRVEVA